MLDDYYDPEEYQIEPKVNVNAAEEEGYLRLLLCAEKDTSWNLLHHPLLDNNCGSLEEEIKMPELSPQHFLVYVGGLLLVEAETPGNVM